MEKTTVHVIDFSCKASLPFRNLCDKVSHFFQLNETNRIVGVCMLRAITGGFDKQISRYVLQYVTKVDLAKKYSKLPVTCDKESGIGASKQATFTFRH